MTEESVWAIQNLEKTLEAFTQAYCEANGIPYSMNDDGIHIRTDDYHKEDR